MKLRNKKTGEIFECNSLRRKQGTSIALAWKIDEHLYEGRDYNSLAELNEEWEDYEEAKDFWFIDPEILIACESTEPLLCDKKVAIETMKQIGNYFETREEAEKAVEKLKAWKRLEDKGFVWKGWEEGAMDNGMCVIGCQIPENNWETDVVKDLDLLFGGEE